MEGPTRSFRWGIREVARYDIVVATSRPPIRMFFEALGEPREPAFRISHVAPAPEAVEADGDLVDAASAVVVDLAPDAMTAIELCRALRARRPDVPLIVLVCCLSPAVSAKLQALVEVGIQGMVDLRASGREMQRLLRAVAGGETVVQLRTSREHAGLLAGLMGGEAAGRAGPKPVVTETDARILGLLVHGLADGEIGKRLHLARSTVHHHIGNLCDALGMRNRTALAVWATLHGYGDPASPDTPAA